MRGTFNPTANTECGYHTVNTSLGEVEFVVSESATCYTWAATKGGKAKVTCDCGQMTFSTSNSAKRDALTEIPNFVASLAMA